MDIDSSVYNKINGMQAVHAEQLLIEIKSDYPDRHFNIIMDIGCGSGNVTNILSHKFPHTSLFAIDIDPQMIQFANDHFPRDSQNNITYIIQDIGQDFESLDPQLQALEGQVDLIFSNFAIHWLEDYEPCCRNIQKLLSSNGVFYTNLGVFPQILTYPLQGLEVELEQHNKIPNTLIGQIDKMRIPLEKLGLKVKATGSPFIYACDSAQQFWEIMKVFTNRFLKQMENFLKMQNKKKRKQFENKVEELVFKGHCVQNDADGFCITSSNSRRGRTVSLGKIVIRAVK